MNWIYSCPKCSAVLNPGTNIILIGRHEGCDLLLAFHPEIGNYEISVPPTISINKGELWDFCCPVCHGDLSMAGEETLACIDMTDDQNNSHCVLFSRIAGEQATFVISRKPEFIVAKYGANLEKYEHLEWEDYVV